MARPSPQTDRVVAVLNLLAAHPSVGFTLPELADQLKIHKTSLYPMISSLLAAGMLLRTPGRKTFELGPALIRLGDVAASSLPVLEAARALVREIHNSLGCHVYAFTCSGGYSTLVEALAPDPDLPIPRLGQRTRMNAPNGAVAIAWADRSMVCKWLGASESHPLPLSILEALAAIRNRGFVIKHREISEEALVGMIEKSHDQVLPQDETEFFEVLARTIAPAHPYVTDLKPDLHYEISGISAPIFDRLGDVVLTVTIVPALNLSGREILEFGNDLVDRTDAVTAMLGGRKPRTF